jgi:hypothetical protein
MAYQNKLEVRKWSFFQRQSNQFQDVLCSEFVPGKDGGEFAAIHPNLSFDYLNDQCRSSSNILALSCTGCLFEFILGDTLLLQDGWEVAEDQLPQYFPHIGYLGLHVLFGEGIEVNESASLIEE